jgi:hypothetical protein
VRGQRPATIQTSLCSGRGVADANPSCERDHSEADQTQRLRHAQNQWSCLRVRNSTLMGRPEADPITASILHLAPRAVRSPSILSDMANGGKYPGTINAAADLARFDLSTVQAAMLVRLYVRWIESVRVKLKHGSRSVYAWADRTRQVWSGMRRFSTPLHIQRIVVSSVITLSHGSQKI